MLPQDSRSPGRQQRWVECVNVGYCDIPPHGACEVTGTVRLENDRTVLQVRRPTKDSLSNVVINGVLAIGVGKFGSCTNDLPAFVLGNIPCPSPCGTVTDSFTMASTSTGFISFGQDAATGTSRVIRVSDANGVRILAFELMKDRVVGAYEERLPVILSISYSNYGCDLPPSNPAAEAMIEKWSEWKGIYPNLNAQLVWFHDTMYPYARGPMDEDDCGITNGSDGAAGLLAYHPDVSVEEDDEAFDSGEYCKKRFEATECDQRSMRFTVTHKEDFPGDSASGEIDIFTAKQDKQKAPKPMNQWPFSQPAHWWEFHSLTDPGDSFQTDKLSCRIRNPMLYRGHVLDPAVVEWNDTTDFWELDRTKVYAHAPLGGIRYNNCKVEKWVDYFKAYGRPPSPPTWETAIQLYEGHYVRDARYTIKGENGIGPAMGYETDTCVLEVDYQTDCFRFTEEPGLDAPNWVNSLAIQTLVPGVKDVTVGTDITFSTYLIFQPCDPIDTDDVVIEGTTLCPP